MLLLHLLVLIAGLPLCCQHTQNQAPRLYNFFHAQMSMKLIEREMYHGHKCQNANNCWHFDIY